ncbi:MAG: sulfotransferase [Pseudohaliea sp.]
MVVRIPGRIPKGGTIAEPAPLFVCGCARSGTTALAQLVGSDRRVLLGIERYAKLARDRFAIDPEHLQPARFARIEDGDTFYDSFDGRHYWDERFSDKLAGRLALAYVGDKKPILYRFWRELFQRFPNARLLFIYRDPLAVARSWERRARVPGGNWPRARDAGAAIDEWNHSCACIRDAVAAGHPVGILSYEHLFNAEWMDRLFAWLQLTPSTEVLATGERLGAAHQRALEKRGGAAPLDLDEAALAARVEQDSWRWLVRKRLA